MEKTIKKHFYEDEKYDGNELAQELKFYDECNGNLFDKIISVIGTITTAPKEMVNFLCILFKLNEKGNIVKTVMKKIVHIFLTIIVYGQCLSIWASIFIVPIFFLCSLGGSGDDHYL